MWQKLWNIFLGILQKGWKKEIESEQEKIDQKNELERMVLEAETKALSDSELDTANDDALERLRNRSAKRR